VRICAVDILFFDWIQMDVIGTLTMSLLCIDPLAYRASLDGALEPSQCASPYHVTDSKR
jgi:hypothetical protein